MPAPRPLGSLVTLIALTVALLSGCGRVEPAAAGRVEEGDVVNLVQAARLIATTRVELVTFLYADTGTTTERVDHVLVEPAEIAALVAALNTPVTVGMAPACVAEHEVRFARADGVIATFVYQCGAEEAKFLRGSTSDGSFQLGGEVVLPVEAGEILARTFAAPAAPVAPQPPATATLPPEPLSQEDLANLAAELEAVLIREQEATFAGIWLAYDPRVHLVVAFTRDGTATLAPYIAGTPLQGRVEVRPATYSLAELRTAQQETYDRLTRLGLNVGSSLDVMNNRVTVQVTDRALFDQRLADAGVTLPVSVVVETIYTPLGPEPPFPLTPVPDLALPQLQTRSVAFMAALLEGNLVVREGCLRVSPGVIMTEYLVIWQPDYYLTQTPDGPVILDRTGAVFARVGAPVALGGGETSLTAELERQLQTPIPPQCTGPYWLMGP